MAFKSETRWFWGSAQSCIQITRERCFHKPKYSNLIQKRFYRITCTIFFNFKRVHHIYKRISIGYLLASVAEIWLVNNIVVDTAAAFTKKYYKQWVMAILLGSLYMCLLYGLYVPSWKFEVSSSSWTSPKDEYISHAQIVQCGMRGSLEPPCNAVGFVDRILIGEHHLYKHPVYRRTQNCSVNSPDYGQLPPNFPGWCLAPFEPEVH